MDKLCLSGCRRFWFGNNTNEQRWFVYHRSTLRLRVNDCCLSSMLCKVLLMYARRNNEENTYNNFTETHYFLTYNTAGCLEVMFAFLFVLMCEQRNITLKVKIACQDVKFAAESLSDLSCSDIASCSFKRVHAYWDSVVQSNRLKYLNNYCNNIYSTHIHGSLTLVSLLISLFYYFVYLFSI